jgi:hypothetical protein
VSVSLQSFLFICDCLSLCTNHVSHPTGHRPVCEERESERSIFITKQKVIFDLFRCVIKIFLFTEHLYCLGHETAFVQVYYWKTVAKLETDPQLLWEWQRQLLPRLWVRDLFSAFPYKNPQVKSFDPKKRTVIMKTRRNNVPSQMTKSLFCIRLERWGPSWCLWLDGKIQREPSTWAHAWVGRFRARWKQTTQIQARTQPFASLYAALSMSIFPLFIFE